MIVLNTNYKIEGSNTGITFSQENENQIVGIYNQGTVTGILEGNLLIATFNNNVENVNGLMEIVFHKNGFNAKWKTSHTIVGTTSAQMKEFELSTGGTLSVVDLPGYGRSLAEDREYEKIYQDTIPSCDLVLLIVQADAKDLADDEEMILKVAEWLKDSPKPQR
jgi:hypothetical protein